jgi:hypothetical protein
VHHACFGPDGRHLFVDRQGSWSFNHL